MTEHSGQRKRRRSRPVPRRNSRTFRGRPVPRIRRRSAALEAPHPRNPTPESTRRELERLSRDLTWERSASAAPRPPLVVEARSLHIVMVGWEYPPHHTGGLGVHCYELCRELGLMGHRVTFLTPFHGPFTATAGVTFRWPGGPKEAAPPYPDAYQTSAGPGEGSSLPMGSFNDWVGGLRDLGPVDIVHVHDWFGTIGGTRLSRALRRPLVMTVHSTEYDRTLGFPTSDILDREKFGVTSADRVIAVSRHLKQQLADRYDVPPSKVTVVYNAVRPTPRLERLQGAVAMVLYLGRLAAMKGVDTFLRAAQRVAAIVPEAMFVVAGEGPEFPHLLTLASHLGISDRVLFVGKVTDEERSLLLAAASVFVLPSVVEPFGIAALEAMAAGVPTILSKTSGVAEISPTAFAVDFWDSEEFASRIVELLEYPELHRLMGAQSKWEALRSGWPERAIETLGVYAQLASRRRERS